ncbi:Transposase for insertion sequence element ISRM3, partial [Exaiptasia diaphana]
CKQKNTSIEEKIMPISNDILDQLIGKAKTEEDLFGKDGLIKELSSKLVNRILENELTTELGFEKNSKSDKKSNYRNGKSQKTVKTDNGEITIDVPRDRNGDFEPTLIPKRKTRLSGLNDQVLKLYGKGMTVRDIESFLLELYGTEVSRDLISTITDGVMDEVQEWRNRPLESVYPIVYIDGFVAKCRHEGSVTNRTVYVIYGINMEGYKDVLGLYIDGTEGAKYWLNVLTELKNRGLDDIFLLCADGLKGLPESVEAVYPKAIFQTCIVHMVRNSLNYVPWEERKEVAKDLRNIYQADTVALAADALDDFELKWGDRFPAIVRSWRNNWSKVIPFFDYPKDIRKVIYTTNIVESLNRVLRKSVKTRGHFPTEDALYKVLYLAISGSAKKWTMPIQNWKAALNQFAIMFEDRFPKEAMIN